MIRLVYNLILFLLTPLWAVYIAWRVLAGSWRERWWERFGFVAVPPPKDKRRIWVHCVSVGETLAALPVLKAMRAALPNAEIVLTTTTPTGQRTAHDSAREWVDYIAYFPLDFPFAVRRALSRIQPDLLTLFETELWLNLLAEQHRREGFTLVLNGRLSDRSFRRAQRVRPFYRQMLEWVDFVCAQSPLDAARFVALGISPARVEVCGNTKFDQALEATDVDPAEWRRRLSLPPEAPVIVVGSTRTPEEERLVAEAYRAVQSQMPDTCLVIAPRHLERVPELNTLLQSYGWNPSLRSRLPLPEGEYAQVVVVDTFGELARLYAVGDVAVVGGAFAPLGGQNLFQPLAHGKPVFFGPHTHNFRDIAQMAKEAGVGFEVADAHALAQGILELLQNPQRRAEIEQKARELIHTHQGATQRTLEHLLRWWNHAQQAHQLALGIRPRKL
ncbi:3-deoxy-D-manno-octulosonic-acid transferase [Armatimonadetes bacterium DC]|nr:3-deoxy-D-manno-octulosonic-acid transferase [Armatimonadetes bacterium DC]